VVSLNVTMKVQQAKSVHPYKPTEEIG